MRSLLRAAPLGLLGFLAAACGSSSSSPTGTDSGSDAKVKADASEAGTHDADHDTGKTGHDAGHDAGVDVGAGGSDAGDAESMDAPFDASGYKPVDGGDAVLTQVTPETWTWVPFAGARCRDGSTTGIGINFNPASTNLVIFLEGGGACFNGLTCSTNPSKFGPADFSGRFPSASDGGTPQTGNGILDRNQANPVKDWSFVYVPYCTGDIHAGNNPSVTVPNVPGTQAFVGYNNVDLYLQRIVPTFKTATQVLLTGISGGGFGAAANYFHVQRAFGAVPVDLIDDSGPWMEDPYLPVCIQDEVRSLWNLDSTLGADCAGHCNDPYRFFLDFAQYGLTKFPQRQLGLIEATDDGTITEFFGFGAQDCTALLPVQESAASFTAGLDDIRTKLAADTNYGGFYFNSTDHTSLADDNFYSRTAGGTSLTTWVGNLVAGHASNAGP